MAPKKPDDAKPASNIVPLKGSRFEALMKGPLAKEIVKEYGPNSFLPASENPILKVRKFIRTGLYPLDIGLGGGLSAGYMTTFYGGKSSAKTTLATRAVATAQQCCASCWQFLSECSCGEKLDAVVGYIDVEGHYDLPWANSVGVATDRLVFTQPGTGEAALDITESLLRSGQCDFVVIDSLAMLQPSKGLGRNMGEPQPGDQARLLGEAMRRFTAAMNDMGNKFGRRPTVLAINQTRLDLSIKFGNPEVQSGGRAPGYTAVCEVKTSAGKVFAEKDANDIETPLYAENRFKVEKNKRRSPKAEGTYRLYFEGTEYKAKGDVGDEQNIIADLEAFGLLTGSGSSWTLFEEKYQGKTKVLERLLSEKPFRRKMYDLLMDAHFAESTPG